jgi:hypothetical protein
VQGRVHPGRDHGAGDPEDHRGGLTGVPAEAGHLERQPLPGTQHGERALYPSGRGERHRELLPVGETTRLAAARIGALGPGSLRGTAPPDPPHGTAVGEHPEPGPNPGALAVQLLRAVPDLQAWVSSSCGASAVGSYACAHPTAVITTSRRAEDWVARDGGADCASLRRGPTLYPSRPSSSAGHPHRRG